jgi:hypothetical protein
MYGRGIYLFSELSGTFTDRGRLFAGAELLPEITRARLAPGHEDISYTLGSDQ